MKYSTRLLAPLWISTLLAGCAAPMTDGDSSAATRTPAPVPPPVQVEAAAAAPQAPAPAPAPVAPVQAREPTAAEKKLAAAQGTFDRGEYALAIRLLTPLTTDNTLDPASQLTALKTLAFSQCLTRATTACRKTFERAFSLDKKFDLAPAERGHPMWWPQFELARKASVAKGK